MLLLREFGLGAWQAVSTAASHSIQVGNRMPPMWALAPIPGSDD